MDLKSLVANDLLKAGAIMDKSGSPDGAGFILVDGTLSPVYVNLRILQSYPGVILPAARLYAQVIRSAALNFDLIAGIPQAATPITALVSQELNVPMITPRLDDKGHGSGAKIDGKYSKGQTALLIDDVITSAKSKIEAYEYIKVLGLNCTDVVVLVDREQGGAEGLKELGISLHSAFTLQGLIEDYRQMGALEVGICDEILSYLAAQKQRRDAIKQALTNLGEQ